MTNFTWILDTDIKGWVPRVIIESVCLALFLFSFLIYFLFSTSFQTIARVLVDNHEIVRRVLEPTRPVKSLNAV